MNATEIGFATAAVVVLAVLLVGVVVGADGDVDEQTVAPDVDVPDVDSFEPTDEPGVATVGDERYDSVQDAVDAADPGDTVVLEGRFEERVIVRTPDVTITSADEFAVVDGGFDDVADANVDAETGADDDAIGGDFEDHVEEDADASGDGTVVEIDADGVTIERVWIRNSGFSATEQNAGVLMAGSNVTVVDSRITDVTFGVWVDSAEGGVLRNNTIVGHEDVPVTAERGNGIHLFEADGTVIEDNAITAVRDGIYFSWASNVLAAGNTMWDSRFGVHYMYSDDCRLVDNVAFDNDVGYALMVSSDLEIVDNVAVNNRGPSGHGILILQIDDTVLEGNEVVGNQNGFHVDNSQRIEIGNNLVMENELGIRITTGSRDEVVSDNSFVRNDRQVFTPMTEQKRWDGNYWSDASVVDLTGDGTSEIRHRPEGLVENLLYENPQAAVFANSPAFDAVRLAESSFPVIESPGVVDDRPLGESDTDWWQYYEN